MKKYLLKIKCNGKNPCIAFKTYEAENPAEAICKANNYFNEIGARDRRQVVAVYEKLWDINSQA